MVFWRGRVGSAGIYVASAAGRVVATTTRLPLHVNTSAAGSGGQACLHARSLQYRAAHRVQAALKQQSVARARQRGRQALAQTRQSSCAPAPVPVRVGAAPRAPQQRPMCGVARGQEHVRVLRLCRGRTEGQPQGPSWSRAESVRVAVDREVQLAGAVPEPWVRPP
jgi:hypothetical protein